MKITLKTGKMKYKIEWEQTDGTWGQLRDSQHNFNTEAEAEKYAQETLEQWAAEENIEGIGYRIIEGGK